MLMKDCGGDSVSGSQRETVDSFLVVQLKIVLAAVTSAGYH